MSGSSWKVAYADFVTALMAFFLLMWIVSMAPEETKVIISEYFTPEYWQHQASGPVSKFGGSPVSNLGTDAASAKLQINEQQQIQYAIAKDIKQVLTSDPTAQTQGGVQADASGVLMYASSDMLFKPNSAELSPKGFELLDKIINIIRKYNVFLVIRGHSDAMETGAPLYPSNWELSSVRATACAEYIIKTGLVKPERVRVVAYGDTRPMVPNTSDKPEALNRRVEFDFIRPEVLSKMKNF